MGPSTRVLPADSETPAEAACLHFPSAVVVKPAGRFRAGNWRRRPVAIVAVLPAMKATPVSSGCSPSGVPRIGDCVKVYGRPGPTTGPGAAQHRATASLVDRHDTIQFTPHPRHCISCKLVCSRGLRFLNRCPWWWLSRIPIRRWQHLARALRTAQHEDTPSQPEFSGGCSFDPLARDRFAMAANIGGCREAVLPRARETELRLRKPAKNSLYRRVGKVSHTFYSYALPNSNEPREFPPLRSFTA